MKLDPTHFVVPVAAFYMDDQGFFCIEPEGAPPIVCNEKQSEEAIEFFVAQGILPDDGLAAGERCQPLYAIWVDLGALN